MNARDGKPAATIPYTPLMPDTLVPEAESFREADAIP
jgi:hypothetical protein